MSLSIGSFNVSNFERMGISVSKKEISAETILYMREQQEAAAKNGDAAPLSEFDTEMLKRARENGKGFSREQILDALKTWQDQFKVLADPTQADDHPSNLYASVVVNGEAVAKIYNSGIIETSNKTSSAIKHLSSMQESESLVGPALAQKRAEQIVQAIGGTIEKAETASTQAEWENRPPLKWTYDYAAMDATSKTLYQAQLLGQESAE